ncbi:hypothetical protein GCM10025876_21820 [Demequina litorisediminis]|uniref:DNA polymerase III gamma subunit domain-containing protein n=1 Tax=Demequina litorisediminis TaxID=1849022 RepID=A0ABQ6IDP4_9MICO|nr:hypothetical protein GCM10025876_21820 [Demequina litorisediminis]
MTYDRAIALLGFTDATLLDDAVDAIAASDGASLFDVVGRVIQTGHEPRRFVEDLLERVRDLLVIAASGGAGAKALGEVPQDQLERMTDQARRMTLPRASRAGDLINDALTSMVGATSPRLHLELLCARLLAAEVPVVAAAPQAGAGAAGGAGGGSGGNAPSAGSVGVGSPSTAAVGGASVRIRCVRCPRSDRGSTRRTGRLARRCPGRGRARTFRSLRVPPVLVCACSGLRRALYFRVRAFAGRSRAVGGARGDRAAASRGPSRASGPPRARAAPGTRGPSRARTRARACA